MVDLCGGEWCGSCSESEVTHLCAVTAGEAGSPLPHPEDTSQGQSAVRSFPCPRGFSQSQSHPKTCTKQIHPAGRGFGHPLPRLVLTQQPHIYIVLLCGLIPGKAMQKDVF